MPMIRNLVFAGMFAAASFAVAPAYALTAKECSVKYQAAKEAGTLGGLKWNDFRKAECASDAAPATETNKSASKTKSDTTTSTAAGGTDGGGGLTMRECSAKYQAADELQTNLYEIYRAAPFTDGKAYKKAQDSLKDNEELMFSDKEIDGMLPTTLRRSSRA